MANFSHRFSIFFLRLLARYAHEMHTLAGIIVFMFNLAVFPKKIGEDLRLSEDSRLLALDLPSATSDEATLIIPDEFLR
jgi:hypothetical protein